MQLGEKDHHGLEPGGGERAIIALSGNVFSFAQERSQADVWAVIIEQPMGEWLTALPECVSSLVLQNGRLLWKSKSWQLDAQLGTLPKKQTLSNFREDLLFFGGHYFIFQTILLGTNART